MAEDQNRDKKTNEDTPEEKRSFTEGVVDGFVEAIMNSFRWLGSTLGGTRGSGSDK